MTDHFPDPGLNVRDLTTIIEEFTMFFIRLPSVERLNFTTVSALHTLSRFGPMRLTELTATQQMTQPAITQMVRRLEDDGLLERRDDPRDARAVLIQLTSRGAQVIEARRAARVERLASLFDLLSPEERATIAAVVPALAHVIALASTPELSVHPQVSESTEQHPESPQVQE